MRCKFLSKSKLTTYLPFKLISSYKNNLVVGTHLSISSFLFPTKTMRTNRKKILTSTPTRDQRFRGVVLLHYKTQDQFSTTWEQLMWWRWTTTSGEDRRLFLVGQVLYSALWKGIFKELNLAEINTETCFAYFRP